MLQAELFRCRYLATKVTTKMLFAVDFGSRPLDHFLALDEDLVLERRLVQHDTSLWSGADPAPRRHIDSPSHLQRALYAIQDASVVWYPDDLARVFRTVAGHSAHALPPWASSTQVSAMCNLYSAVFASLSASLRSGADLRRLDAVAQGMLHRDSAQYQRYVGQVLTDAVMHAVLRDPTALSRVAAPARPPAHPTARARRSNPPGGRGPQQPVVPAHLRSQIPALNGTEYCLRFQTMKDCDFPKCKREHALTPLTPGVKAWLEGAHGSLKSDHPSFQ
jgi:hypothetical protein